MAPKTAHQAAKKKAAKEKKLLMLLIVPAAAAGFFAYHTISKLHHPTNLPLATAPATAPATTPPGSSAATAAPTGVAGASVALSVASGGTLSSLAGLKPKDPFHTAGPHTSTTSSSTTASSTPTQSSSSGKSGSNSKQGSKQKTGAKTPSAPPTAAVISINGKAHSIALHSTFGHARGFADQPLFKLVAVTQKTATISIVGSPHQRYTLKLRRMRAFTDTLGNLYRLKLLPPGTSVPGAATSTTQTTTTPTTTGSYGFSG